MSARTALAVTVLLALAGPATAGGAPVRERGDWRAHVLDPRAPVVTAARGLVVDAGRPRIVDLGVNTGGRVEVDVRDATPGARLRLAYAEARALLTPEGDTTGASLGPDDAPDGRFDVLDAHAGARWRSPAVRGGQRYVRVAVEGAGRVTLDALRVRVRHLRVRPGDYEGHFLSSDPVLNDAWYAAAYTYDVSVAGSPPVLMDGAKRDRLVFTGDLALGQLVGLHTVRQGRAISRNALWLFSCQQGADGLIPGYSTIDVRCPPVPPTPAAPPPPLRSGEYVAWYVVAAEEYELLTGDRATVRALLPVLRRAVGYLRASERDGLYARDEDQGFEFNWRAQANFGASAYTNVVYVRALRSLAALERRVAGDEPAARALESHARAVGRALVARLWDPRAGALRSSTRDPLPAQDANVQAVLAGGILSAAQERAAMRFVDRRLRTRLGTRVGGGGPQFISPFQAGWELLARFDRGDARGALALVRRLWGHMLREGPGTAWEKVALDGDPQPNDGGRPGAPTTRPEGEGYVSLAHAWSGGPVPAMSRHVLGIRATAPGYRRWRIAPQPGGLRWAQGQVPTPRGPIVSRWERRGGKLALTVRAPRGTRGTAVLPGERGRRLVGDGREHTVVG